MLSHNMVRYRITLNGHYIPIQEMPKCDEWVERQRGDKFVFTCKSNPSIEKVLDKSEVITFTRV